MTRRMLGDAGHGTDPTTVSDTVRAGAGLVVEQHGWAQEAIDHALAARNVTRAVGLIARHWYATVDAGRAATVAGWLHSLGDDQIAASPLAAHCMAWTAALTGDRETVRRCLPVIEAGAYDGALPDGMRSLQSSAALLVGTFGITGLAATREAAARAMELESDPASPWYGVARAAFGTAQYFSGELRAATRQLEEALICGLPAAFIRMYALTVMTVIAVQESRLEQAHEMARAARELATDPALGLRDAPQGSLARIAAGAVDAATGRLEEARSEFRHAQLSRRPWPGLNPWADFEIQLRLAPVLLQLDDRSGAEALVGRPGQNTAGLVPRRSGGPAGQAGAARATAHGRRTGGYGRGNTHRTRAASAVCGCYKERSRCGRSGRNCTCQRTRSRLITTPSIASSVSLAGTTQ